MWLRPKNASNVRIPGAGHLVDLSYRLFLVMYANANCGVFFSDTTRAAPITGYVLPSSLLSIY